MINVEITDLTLLIAFWLSFTRWVTTLYQLPFFDNVIIPDIVKILFSVVITYAFFPFVKETIYRDMAFVGQEHFWVLTIAYTLMGLMIGFLIKSIMNAYIMAGTLITQNIGLSASRYFDPTFQAIGPFEKLIQETMIVLIVTSGAIAPMFKGTFLAFEKFNLVTMYAFIADFEMQWFLDFIKSLFLAGLVLAAPVMVMNLLLTVVMGVITKAIPQMNILVISFIINIGVGFLVFALISEDFFRVAFDLYQGYLIDWYNIIS
ncbi:MAG: flagellar biosynthetic protein FliR [Oligoflexia bacterium]|nr:flagellar biosynthetic protein FliR [Oligoflexia bacterium]MBF0364591.1 flagellar biosynthetic protein FliR [Oligoflexia bacterium]